MMSTMMSGKSSKLWKLVVHEHGFCEDEVIINKDDSGLTIGDVIEIYLPNSTFSRLLANVRNLNTCRGAGSISILKSLAKEFRLPAYSDVIVNVVRKEVVFLDTLELVVKDQFLTRGDMWRLHRSIIGLCVHIGKKLSLPDARAQVNELWMEGTKVACGVVGATTKLVYRSQSARVHVFIQMSAEMWQADLYGDLYFEKVITGYLREMFSEWRNRQCSHEVLIVLFSRTRYQEKSIGEFPPEMQKDVTCNVDGRFYQDFYHVLPVSKTPSEKTGDCLEDIIVKLKKSFRSYKGTVCGRCDDDCKNCRWMGRNSRATDGNILEAINMSLNVFEKHYIDCSLEETNWSMQIITPSTGVFEVERDLTMLTKQRLIDNGVGVDLVCLAVQPLHAVPLLKFLPRSSFQTADETVYNIPQWINLSYYMSPPAPTQTPIFVSRMQVPIQASATAHRLEPNATPLSKEEIDYDEYDANVFNYSTPKSKSFIRPSFIHSSHKSIVDSIQSSPESYRTNQSQSSQQTVQLKQFSLPQDAPLTRVRRSISDEPGKPGKHGGSFTDLQFTMGSEHDGTPKDVISDHMITSHQSCATDAATGQSKHTAKINPFKPRDMANAVTLFRQRWLHTFPRDSCGGARLQEHHQKVKIDEFVPKVAVPAPEVEEAILASIEENKLLVTEQPTMSQSDAGTGASSDGEHAEAAPMENGNSVPGSSSTGTMDKEHCFENRDLPPINRQESEIAIMTRVDWKSLSIPACMPLTINHFPELSSLKDDYLEYNYTYVITDTDTCAEQIGASESGRFDRSNMPEKDKFKEMISQRIGQGFQFVTNPDVISVLKLQTDTLDSMAFNEENDYVLSLGMTIHHLKLSGAEVAVTIYILKDPPVHDRILYRYKLFPDNGTRYLGSCTSFSYFDMNKYGWNTLDRYIIEMQAEYNQLTEQMHYWRARYILLPDEPIVDAGQERVMDLIEGFLRILEGLNRIKRPTSNRQLFTRRGQDSFRKQRYPLSTSSDATSSSLMDNHVSHVSGGHVRTPEKDSPNKGSEHKKNAGSEHQSKVGELHRKSIAISIEQDMMASSSTDSTSSAPSVAVPGYQPPEHILSMESSLMEVIDAVKNKEYGLTFLPVQSNLREFTFIGAELVAWMIKCIDGCFSKNHAVSLGQRLLDEKFFVHASLSPSQKFMDGFYLYSIQPDREKGEDQEKRFQRFWQPRKTEDELLSSFNIKWLEVAVWRDELEKRPSFLSIDLPHDSLMEKKFQTKSRANMTREEILNDDTYAPLYKTMEYNLDPEIKKLSQQQNAAAGLLERSEWCAIAYHGNYFPNKCAYSIELHWMVATGGVVTEMVKDWQRRAASQRLRLIPAPMCTFPKSTVRCNQNPLRKPSFIPLNLECLMAPGSIHLFQDYERSTWFRRVLLFQESILIKLHFLRDMVMTCPESKLHKTYSVNAKAFQYIHTSGSVLVEMLDPTPSTHLPKEDEAKVEESPFRKRRLKTEKAGGRGGLPEVDQNDEFLNLNGQVGFFWMPNFALSKKIASAPPTRKSQVGQKSASEVIADLSDFCSNVDNRLLDYWNECLEQSRAFGADVPRTATKDVKVTAQKL